VKARISRRIARRLAAVFAFYLAASFVVGVFLAENTLRVPRRPVAQSDDFRAAVSRDFHARVQDAQIEARDGAVLKAWYVRPASWNGSSVVLLHGLGDNREGAAGFAPIFLGANYAVLIPDSRAHGQSGGAIATYGILERDDIRRWADWLRQASPGCVDLFGESMGAAIALQAMEATPNLCAVVAESPFASFREIACDRLSQTAGFGLAFSRTIARPSLEAALLYARLRYGVDLAAAQPQASVARSKVPVLLISDADDSNIAPRHQARIMQTAGPQDRIWIVPGAEHTGAGRAAGEEFQRRVLDWFAKHTTPRPLPHEQRRDA